MKEERLEILKMLQEGIISAEEAEKLLSALHSGEERKKKTRGPGVFSGKDFFQELDKGLSGIGRVVEGVMDNINFFHPDYEPFESTNGSISCKPGDTLHIQQQIGITSGSCSLEIDRGSPGQITIESDSSSAYEVKKKDNHILIICYNEFSMNLPDDLEEVSVKLLNGDMTIRGIVSTFNGETLNGDIEIEDCPNPRHIKSLRGDIEVVMSPDFNGNCEIATLNGDVSIEVDNDYSGVIFASAVSGEINCSMRENVKIHKSNDNVKEKLKIEINDGDPRNSILCSTLCGDINIESDQEL